MQNIIPGFVLLVAGGLIAIQPEMCFKFCTWLARRVLGMHIVVGTRTMKTYRILGSVLVVMGLAILVFG